MALLLNIPRTAPRVCGAHVEYSKPKGCTGGPDEVKREPETKQVEAAGREGALQLLREADQLKCTLSSACLTLGGLDPFWDTSTPAASFSSAAACFLVLGSDGDAAVGSSTLRVTAGVN